MALNFTYFIFFVVGGFLAYILVFLRYKKEINIRLKWINKKLKNQKWQFPLALFAVYYISSFLIRSIFSIISDKFILKPFFISFFFVPFFTLFLFKYFYEIIGGKRKWKL